MKVVAIGLLLSAVLSWSVSTQEVVIDDTAFDLPDSNSVVLSFNEGSFLQFDFSAGFGESVSADPSDFVIEIMSIPEFGTAFFETKVGGSLVSVNVGDILESDTDVFITPPRPKVFNFNPVTNAPQCVASAFSSCAVDFTYRLLQNSNRTIASENVDVDVRIVAVENPVFSLVGPQTFVTEDALLDLSADDSAGFSLLYDFGENIFSVTVDIFISASITVDSSFVASFVVINAAKSGTCDVLETSACYALSVVGLPNSVQSALNLLVFTSTVEDGNKIVFRGFGTSVGDASAGFKRSAWVVAPPTESPTASPATIPKELNGALIGGVAGAAVALLFIVGAVLVTQNRKMIKQRARQASIKFVIDEADGAPSQKQADIPVPGAQMEEEKATAEI